MHSYIINKYNRMLYFLLGIYIILVFVLSLLFNDFFVKPKAFTDGNSYTLNGTLSMIGGGAYNTSQLRCSSSGRTKTIFYIDPEFAELMNQNYTANSTDSVSLFRFEDPYNLGGTFSQDIVNVNDHGMGATCWNYIGYVGIGEDTPIWQYFHNKGVDLPVDYYRPWLLYMAHTYSGDSDKMASISLDSDIEYVDTPQALYDYMVNGNNEVIKVGDPDSPTLDSQIPTPQKVAVYKDSTSPSLVWSNPKGITNNENIKVRIEWKPVLTLTHGLYDVNTITTDDYELLYYDNINDYNSFCTLNNNGSPPPNVLNSYNTIYDSKVLFSGTGAQQSNDWANYYIVKNNIDWVSRVDPFGTNDLFGKGTYSGVRVPDLKYRIRYETETGVSDWIYSDREFDSDNVSGPSQHSSTHSRNASGDPVSNPTYTPNNDNKVIPQNEVDDQNDSDKQKSNSIFDFISGFFDTIISAITAIFAKLKEIVDSISNGTGSFFSFFADLFGAFPQLFGIFLLGLVVTVLLRVLGR